ncbi:MAG: PD40 domain-containing protein [Bacteroidetes bacterium]|nr:PD40 domain-containing protein [Bacteroidota bacterium]MBI3483196.1 PD40 domain-containing protein [Bacteroidota bacterium]
MKSIVALIFLFSPFLISFQSNKQFIKPVGDSIHYSREKHFKNVRQLTFGADNAEAYWSFDGKHISFQSNNKDWGLSCDQIFYMPIDGMDLNNGIKPQLISTGMGRTTCAFFLPNGKSILYASTHLGGKECPKDVERTPGGKYLWPIYDSYDIFVADLSGKITKQLTRSTGYDAEATVSPKGDKIIFTSTRNGDLDLYVMDTNGENVKQITHELGYDGGAFFSPDGKKIVFRASRFKSDEEKKEYLDYLKQGLVAPIAMEIFTRNVDGSDLKQITNLGKANWAPFYHPSGKKIIFSSNYKGKRGFEFNLFMINEDGSELEQITYDKVFDSFPMFSPDGKKILFSSNRNNRGTRNTNLFVADWID